MFYNDKLAGNGEQIVELMANHFQTAYINYGNNNDGISHASSVAFDKFALDITLEETFQYLSNLRSNYSCGPDNIPNFFLKQCKYSLCIPINNIFSKSLRFGIFLQLGKNHLLNQSTNLDQRIILKIAEAFLFNPLYLNCLTK